MNLSTELGNWLSPEAGVLLSRVGSIASSLGHRAYLVGGPVRDLLLGCASLDLDVVIEGDAVAVALSAAVDGEAPPRVHRVFGTATLMAGRFRVDLATARSESYELPGALPLVRPGSIEDDLKRRDFTINAMALALNGRRHGELLDPYGGWKDLQRGLLRVLHDDSFVDDATRMLRGVRYEQRFGFFFEEHTGRLLQRDADRLQHISADRVRHEFERTFEEGEPELVMLRLESLGLLARLHPDLHFEAEQAWAFIRARGQRLSDVELTLLYWCITVWGMPAAGLPRLATRLNLPRRIADALHDTIALPAVEQRLAVRALRPAEVYGLLHGYHRVALRCARLMYRHAGARERIDLYLDRLSHARTLLSGSDLRELGAAAGPEIGRMLGVLLSARLNGEIASREEEMALARRLLANIR